MKRHISQVRSWVSEIRSFLGRSPLVMAKNILMGYVRYRFYYRNPMPPRFLVLFTTSHCDAKCIMCGIWRPSPKKAAELTPHQFRQILKDNLFGTIDYFHIDGGEATLREDLPELVRESLAVLPRVTKASIVTNGLDSDRVVTRCLELQEIFAARGIHFAICVSLHGLGETCSEIRGVPESFTRGTETLLRLRDLQRERGFYLRSTAYSPPPAWMTLLGFYLGAGKPASR